MSPRKDATRSIRIRYVRLPRLLLFVMLAVGTCFSFPAISAPDSFEAFAIENWQTDNGLPQNSVTAVFQGEDGYIYAGTYNGMVRFDGVRFVTYDSANTPALKNSRVTALHQDARGRIWIGHESGEVSWLEQGEFHSMNLGTNWPGGEIVGFGCDEDGDTWAVNNFGVLLRLRDQKVLPSMINLFNGESSLVGMAREKDGRLWITYRGAAGFLDHGELKRTNFDSTATNSYFNSVGPSRDGGMWVAGEGQLRKWNGNRWMRNLGVVPWGDQISITAILETQSGQLLVSTLDVGIFIFDPSGAVSHVSRTNGLSHDWVRSMAEDREGNIWVGTSGGGLCVLRPRKVAMFSPPDDWQGRSVLSVTSGADEAVWAGTEGAGIYRFKNNAWSHFDGAAGLSNLFVWSALEDRRGILWAGTWQGGVFRRTSGLFEMPDGLKNFNVPVTALLQEDDRSMILGTVAGLLRYREGEYEWLMRAEHAPWPDIRALAQESDGTIWFGMNSGGGLGKWQQGRVSRFGKKDGLASDFILSLYHDPDGTLWIGSLDNGLCRLKDGKFFTINSKSGLANDVICGIADDGLGNLWFSSQNGIFRCTKSELNDCADGKTSSVHCLIYGKRQGLATPACSGGFEPAVCRTSDGRIWFPTGKGLAVVNPNEVRVNRIKPPVWIEEAFVDGKQAALVRTNYSSGSLTLNPGQQRLQFHFTALSLTSPERVEFKYKLEPLETDWMSAGNQREVNYTYLQPGNYRFHVIACNNDGLWNEDGASVAVIVLPHFWQTWWFRVLAYSGTIILFGAIVLQVTRRRLQLKLERVERQRALERERARIAKDIHDDLGATLTQITMLSQTASQELVRPEQAAKHLQQIFRAARASTHALDEIVWAVNPKHDSLDSMATYLVKFAQDFLGPAGIRCRLDMPLQLPAWGLTAEVRHNLFLAYKEALNNAVKHASATEVRISLALGTEKFELCVADNGSGFNVSEKISETALQPERLGGGNGLENMKRRLEEIGGTCEIESAPGQGTKVKFVVAAKTQRTF